MKRSAGWWLLACSGAWAGTDPRTCARIDEDAARLACYDLYFGRTASTATSPAKAAAADPVAAFGDHGQLPASRRVQGDLPKRLELHVVKAEPLAGGLYRLTMDNDQVWVTREADWALEFKSGDAVTIQRMVLGAFRISHSGQGRNVSVGRIL